MLLLLGFRIPSEEMKREEAHLDGLMWAADRVRGSNLHYLKIAEG